MKTFLGNARGFILPFALAALLAPGCGKKSNPAAPPGGGSTVESFDSGGFSSGTFVHTFAAAGTYRYHCSIHGTQTTGMFGDVVCSPGMPAAATVNIVASTFSPATVQVLPGGSVTWVSSGALHTVTRP